MRSENPCYGCARFCKCDMPMYNRVRCFKYEEASDLPFRRNSYEDTAFGAERQVVRHD